MANYTLNATVHNSDPKYPQKVYFSKKSPLQNGDDKFPRFARNLKICAR